MQSYIQKSDYQRFLCHKISFTAHFLIFRKSELNGLKDPLVIKNLNANIKVKGQLYQEIRVREGCLAGFRHYL